MAPNKDFYKTLGVAESATADEIKKAYRKLAKRYHPDVTGGDKAKENRFKEISEAYETLGDEKKRAQYDTVRKHPFAASGGFDPSHFQGGFPGGFPGGAGRGRRTTRVEVNDLGDLFSGMPRGGGGGSGGFYEMFADMFSGREGGQATARAHAPEKGGDVHSRIDIDLPLAALGGDLPLTVDGKRLTVKVPPGIEDGQTVRIAGQGQPAPKPGSSPGDLLLTVGVRPHPQFTRKGDDLEVNVPIAVDQAVLGAKVDVATLEGPAKVTIPPSTSSGLKLRLRGKGARKRGSAERGDLYGVVQINVPKEVPPRARELIEEFAKLTRPA